MAKTTRSLLLFALLLACQTVWAQPQSFRQQKAVADSLYAIKQYEKAAMAYERAAGNSAKALVSQKATLFANMGHCYKALGKYDQALSSYEQIERLRYAGQLSEEVALLKSDIYIYTGRYDKALQSLLSLKTSDAQTESRRLMNLATTYESLALNAPQNMARQYHDRALNLFDSIRTEHHQTKDIYYITATNNKGYVLWDMHLSNNAYEHVAEAVSLMEPNTLPYYQTLGNLALIESETDRPDMAINHINDCIDWMEHNFSDTHPDYIAMLRKRAEILLRSGNNEAATQAFKAFFRQQRKDIVGRFATMSAQERQDYWNTKRRLIAECLSVGEYDAAFAADVAVFIKSVMVQSSREFLTATNSNAQNRDLLDRLAMLRRKAANATSDESKRIEEEAEAIERKLMKQSKIYSQYLRSLSMGRREVVAALVNPNDVAIEFVRYPLHQEQRYAAVVMQGNGKTTFVPMFAESDIEHYLIRGSRLMGTLSTNIKSTTRADKNNIFSDDDLQHLIWDDILAQVPRNATIYFAPEGILNLLAIEYMELAADHHDLYRLSASRVLTQKKQSGPLGNTLLVGGIDYDDDNESEHIDHPLPDRTGSNQLFAEVIERGKGTDFQPLPGTIEEVNHVKELLNTRPVTLYTASHAPEQRIKNDISLFSSLLISTHGYAYEIGNSYPTHALDSVRRDLSMSRCGIALSGVNKASLPDSTNVNVEDGLLTAMELSQLDLSKLQLAVLSACQTAQGNTRNEGMVGLPLGLKKAGAATVVVSMWPVDDEATRLLQGFFFENIASGNFDNATQAMNNARNRLRNHKTKATQSKFNAGTMSHRPSPKGEKKPFNKPYFYNSFIVIDGI